MVINEPVQKIENALPKSPRKRGAVDQLTNILQVVEEMRETVSAQDIKISELQSRVTDLEDENSQLCRAAISDLGILRTLRRRVLLDIARQKILATWRPSRSARWHEFRETYSSNADFITSSEVFSLPLTAEGLETVLDTHANIHVAGNLIAHEANKELIRDAVQHAETPYDVRVWESVYNKAFN